MYRFNYSLVKHLQNFYFSGFPLLHSGAVRIQMDGLVFTVQNFD